MGRPSLDARDRKSTRLNQSPCNLVCRLLLEKKKSAKEIDKDLNVLLLIHPRDLQPEQEYALDQFVLRGGKLIAFVDPYAYFDQSPQMPGVPPQPSSSDLPTLF